MNIDVKKSSKFRVRSMKIFLTFSKVSRNMNKELIREEIVKLCESKNSGLSGVAIAQEKHTDGTYHFHVYLRFSRPIATENPRYFDILGSHPNFSAVRNEEATFLYLLKEDKEVYMNEYMRKQSLKYDECAMYHIENYLRRGYGPDYAITELGKYGFHNRSKVTGWYKSVMNTNTVKEEISKKGWSSINLAILKKYFKPEVYDIFKIAVDAAEKGIPRPFKSPNLFLWSSKPNMGKTTFTRYFKDKLSHFTFPIDAWWDGYENGRYQLITWNEMDFVKWRFTELNLLFEGSPLHLPIKGAKTPKKDNPLIIATANYSLRQLVKKRERNAELAKISLGALRARIIEIEIKDKWLFKLLDELIASDKKKEDIASSTIQ